MKSIFVTGATGFVGRAITRRLLAAGYEVTALVLPHEAAPTGMRVIHGDITAPQSFAQHLGGHDAVVHLAAAVGYGQDWTLCKELNVRGTSALANRALQAGVRRFVHFSSVAVYGRVPNVRITEYSPFRRTGDPYGDTKIEAEELLWALARRGAIDLTVLRPTVIYGPGDQRFIGKLLENLRSGRARIIGSGDHVVDLVHVDDVASFVIRVLSEPSSIGAAFNLNNPKNPSWRALLRLIAEEIGVEPPTKSLPYPAALALASLMELLQRVTGKPPLLTRYAVRVVGRPYFYDTTQAQALGFTELIPLERGLPLCLRAPPPEPIPLERGLPLCLRTPGPPELPQTSDPSARA